jgi:hypothetical protein
MMVGRRATAGNIKAAARYWPQADVRDFSDLPDGGWADKGSGAIYDPLISDPLFAPNPTKLASAFCVHDGGLVFLRRRGDATVETLQADRQRADREREQAEAAHAKFIARQPQVPLLLADLGERFDVTLREAARRILDSGGQIERGQFGELRVTVPAQLGTEPMLEQEQKRPLVNAAEVLIAAHAVVLAELDRADGDRSARRQRLDQRLPDARPTIGGGI